MSIYSSLRTALYNSSKALIPNNEVIHSHQGAQEPKNSYCSINILKTNKIGMEYENTYATPDPTISSVSVYEVTVRYMFIGQEAGDVAYEFETVADNPASRFYFGTESLAIMRKGEVRRIPEKRDTTWVENFILDVVFSYAVVTSQPIDIIETVSWNENIIP
jgi:hypothetical protein